MWLAEALGTAPSMPVCLYWHPIAKSVFAGPTAELATPCVTYYQKSKDQEAIRRQFCRYLS